jgi:hypothetical protein
MKKLSGACPIANCPGIYDPEDGSGDETAGALKMVTTAARSTLS